MSYTVITTFNDAGRELYGQRMIDHFEQHWPTEVDLRVYAENCQPTVKRGNTQVLDILAVSQPCRDFVERHRNNPEAHGGAGAHNQAVYLKDKTFRWQAVRFCYKIFSVYHAAHSVNTDWLIWLDADTVTHSNVPPSWLELVCPSGHYLSYLGRTDNYHSECGWVAYNLKNPHTLGFIDRLAEMYIRDEIFRYPEWHDSYIWDVVRKQWRDQHGAIPFNLNPEPDTKGLAKHPFINSELGRYMDHFKGDRKKFGRSKSKEVQLHRDLPYWQGVLKS